jgi:hypothetical protein
MLTGLLEGLQGPGEAELRSVEHDVDRKRTAALPLAMIAVADNRGERVTGDLVGHLTAEAPSGPSHGRATYAAVGRAFGSEDIILARRSDGDVGDADPGRGVDGVDDVGCELLGSDRPVPDTVRVALLGIEPVQPGHQ